MNEMRYTTGRCDIDKLRHRMMARGMRSKIGTATVKALQELLRGGNQVGVGVVDWQSGHAMTVYPAVDNTVIWYYHEHQAADIAADYRVRGQIRRVTHFPSDGYILVDNLA